MNFILDVVFRFWIGLVYAAGEILVKQWSRQFGASSLSNRTCKLLQRNGDKILSKWSIEGSPIFILFIVIEESHIFILLIMISNWHFASTNWKNKWPINKVTQSLPLSLSVRIGITRLLVTLEAGSKSWRNPCAKNKITWEHKQAQLDFK